MADTAAAIASVLAERGLDASITAAAVQACADAADHPPELPRPAHVPHPLPDVELDGEINVPYDFDDDGDGRGGGGGEYDDDGGEFDDGAYGEMWPYMPPGAELGGPVPYPAEYGDALLADALAAGWPLPSGMQAPTVWDLGAPVVPGVDQLSLPCELAAEASLLLHAAQLAAADQVLRAHRRRAHFSIPDVTVTADPEEGGGTTQQVTVPPHKRRSMVFHPESLSSPTLSPDSDEQPEQDMMPYPADCPSGHAWSQQPWQSPPSLPQANAQAQYRRQTQSSLSSATDAWATPQTSPTTSPHEESFLPMTRLHDTEATSPRDENLIGATARLVLASASSAQTRLQMAAMACSAPDRGRFSWLRKIGSQPSLDDTPPVPNTHDLLKRNACRNSEENRADTNKVQRCSADLPPQRRSTDLPPRSIPPTTPVPSIPAPALGTACSPDPPKSTRTPPAHDVATVSWSPPSSAPPLYPITSPSPTAAEGSAVTFAEDPLASPSQTVPPTPLISPPSPPIAAAATSTAVPAPPVSGPTSAPTAVKNKQSENRSGSSTGIANRLSYAVPADLLADCPWIVETPSSTNSRSPTPKTPEPETDQPAASSTHVHADRGAATVEHKSQQSRTFPALDNFSNKEEASLASTLGSPEIFSAVLHAPPVREGLLPDAVPLASLSPLDEGLRRSSSKAADAMSPPSGPTSPPRSWAAPPVQTAQSALSSSERGAAVSTRVHSPPGGVRSPPVPDPTVRLQPPVSQPATCRPLAAPLVSAAPPMPHAPLSEAIRKRLGSDRSDSGPTESLDSMNDSAKHSKVTRNRRRSLADRKAAWQASKAAAKAEKAKFKAEASMLKDLHRVDRMVRAHDAKQARGEEKEDEGKLKMWKRMTVVLASPSTHSKTTLPHVAFPLSSPRPDLQSRHVSVPFPPTSDFQSPGSPPPPSFQSPGFQPACLRESPAQQLTQHLSSPLVLPASVPLAPSKASHPASRASSRSSSRSAQSSVCRVPSIKDASPTLARSSSGRSFGRSSSPPHLAKPLRAPTNQCPEYTPTHVPAQSPMPAHVPTPSPGLGVFSSSSVSTPAVAPNCAQPLNTAPDAVPPRDLSINTAALRNAGRASLDAASGVGQEVTCDSNSSQPSQSLFSPSPSQELSTHSSSTTMSGDVPLQVGLGTSMPPARPTSATYTLRRRTAAQKELDTYVFPRRAVT